MSKACPNGCGPLEPFGEVDIGAGVQQFGPWGCPACHWVESTEETLTELADDMESASMCKPPLTSYTAAQYAQAMARSAGLLAALAAQAAQAAQQAQAMAQQLTAPYPQVNVRIVPPPPPTAVTRTHQNSCPHCGNDHL